MDIYEKMHKIMSEVESLKKDGNASFGSTNYNYLSEAKTTQIFREKFVENKLLLFPIQVEETKDKDSKITLGKYTYRLVNVEAPEEYIELQSGGQGHDSTDKGSGKASSYAYKYLLWRTFAVPSNDDPDSITSDETVSKEKAKKAEAEAKKKEAEAKLAKEMETLAAEIKGYAKTLGLTMAKLPAFFLKKYEKDLATATKADLKKCAADMKAAVAEKANADEKA